MFLLLCRFFDACEDVVGEWLVRRIDDGVCTTSIASQSIRRSCNRRLSIVSAFAARLYEFALYHMATQDFFDCEKPRQAIVLGPNKVDAIFWMMDAISGLESNLTPSLLLIFAITCITEDNNFVCNLNHSVWPFFVSAKDKIVEIIDGLIAINANLCCFSIVAWCIIGDAVVFVSNILHGAWIMVFARERLLLPLLFVTRTIDLIGQPSALVLFRRGIEKMKTKALFTCYLLIVIYYSWSENQGSPVDGDNHHKEASVQPREKSDYNTFVKPYRASRDTIIVTIITFLLYFYVGWEFWMVLAMPSKREKKKKETNSVTNNEGKGIYHHSTKKFAEEEQIVDSSLSKTKLGERDNQTQSSSLLANGAEETHQQEEKIILCRKPDLPTPPPGFFRMRRLKQRKQARLRRIKIDPPPGFYRMKELKRQKELAMRLQQKNAPSPGFESTKSSPLDQAAKATNNRRLKPNRKRRSKSRTRRPQHLEEIINGDITDKIPEDFAVYLGSPSPKKRGRKFQEMFRKEQIGTRVRKFLF